MSDITATLVKGDQRLPLAIGAMSTASGLQPLPYFPGDDPPDSKTIKLLTEGPSKHSWLSPGH